MFNYLRERRRASAEMAELEKRARACGVERWTVNGVVERLEELCMENEVWRASNPKFPISAERFDELLREMEMQ